MSEFIPLKTSNLQAISDKVVSGNAVEVPGYPRVIKQRICHLGVGAFHRAHQAVYLHQLLQQGLAQGWGICGIGLRPADQAIHQALQRQDHLYSVWELEGDSKRVSVIGSIMDYVDASKDLSAAVAVLSDAETRIISLTITEAGYCLTASGKLNLQHEDIAYDLVNPEKPRSAPGLIVRALQVRRDAGLKGLTLMSCDNLIENGLRLKESILGFSQQIDSSLSEWIEQEVSFPCSMVDRITPALSAAQRQQFVSEWGAQDDALIMCESWLQWILEDHFIAGRPEFEKAGVVISDDVKVYEDMKVGLLNGGHSALSHIGLLLGYTQVHEALADPKLSRWLLAYMGEVSETLQAIPGINFAEYQASLIQRFSNSAIADRLTRLAQDSSAKFQQNMLPPLIKRLSKGLSTPYFAASITFWIHYLATLPAAGPDRDAYLDPHREEIIKLAVEASTSKDPARFVTAILQLSPEFTQRFSSDVAAHLRAIETTGITAHVATLGASLETRS